MNFLLNPHNAYGLRPYTNSSADLLATYLCKYSRFTNPLISDLPFMITVLVTANLANLPVLVQSNNDYNWHELALKVDDDRLYVVRYEYHSEDSHVVCTPKILAEYDRHAEDPSADTTTHKLVDDFCTILTTHETAPITSCPTDSGHEDLTVGFVHVPTLDNARNEMRISLVSDSAEHVFASSNVSNIQFCDQVGRWTSVSAYNIGLAMSTIWRTAQYENSVLSRPTALTASDEEGFYITFSWPGPGVANATFHFDTSYSLNGGAQTAVDNNAFVKLVLEGARRLDKLSSFVRGSAGGSGADVDYDRIQSMITASTSSVNSHSDELATSLVTQLEAISTAIGEIDYADELTDITKRLADIASRNQTDIGVVGAVVLAAARRMMSPKRFNEIMDSLSKVKYPTITALTDDTEAGEGETGPLATYFKLFDPYGRINKENLND